MTLIEMATLSVVLFVGAWIGHAVAGVWGTVFGAPLGIVTLFAQDYVRQWLRSRARDA